MKTTFDEEFTRLCAACRRHIRAGQIDLYSSDLKEMAKLFEGENRFTEELRMLIPAFYIDLSGLGKAPYIDSSLPEMLWVAIPESGLNTRQISEMYFDLIHRDFIPNHTMSVKESFYIFQLCIDKKVEHAEYVLSRI